MADTNPPALPAWIHKRDGRLVPFDPDKITQSLFATTERLGRSNAFLARELTESILHFLAQELGESTPSSAQVAELVAKVVRELGHPVLASAYIEARQPPAKEAGKKHQQPVTITLAAPAESAPGPLLDECASQFSLRRIFSRDLVAAQEEGWLKLTGLDRPSELAAGVLDWPGREGRSLLSALLESRRRIGGLVAIDGPEFALEAGPGRNRQVALFVRDLKEGLEATKLRAVINANSVMAPPWAWQPAEGPLFQSGMPITEADQSALLDSLLEAILDQFQPGDPMRLDWHVTERDFIEQDRRDRLAQVARRALEDPQVGFVFDRPDRPLSLAEGLDRKHVAVLQTIGLNLIRLMDISGVENDLELLLQKLSSLTAMALSVAVQKRAFLRQLDDKKFSMRRGFLLDRARLLVIPIGLQAVVQHVTGQGVASGKQALSAARQILQALRTHLERAGRAANVDTVIDSPSWGRREDSLGPLFSSPHLLGLTSADLSAAPEEQLRAGGSLHQVAGAGTATLLLPRRPHFSSDDLIELMLLAWRKTELNRVRLARTPALVAETPDLLAPV